MVSFASGALVPIPILPVEIIWFPVNVFPAERSASLCGNYFREWIEGKFLGVVTQSMVFFFQSKSVEPTGRQSSYGREQD